MAGLWQSLVSERHVRKQLHETRNSHHRCLIGPLWYLDGTSTIAMDTLPSFDLRPRQFRI